MDQVHIETGSFISDAGDWAADRVEDLGDALKDVYEAIPGSDLLGDAVKTVVTGPLKDFANGDIGKTVLRAMSTVAMQGAAAMPFLAVPMMAAAATIPGLAQGKNFREAAVQEWAWRLETTAQILGPQIAAQLGEKVGVAANKLLGEASKLFPDLDAADALSKLGEMGISAEGFGVPGREAAERWAKKKAAELGERVDTVLQAYDLNSGTSWFDPARFNVYTGEPLVSVSRPASTPTVNVKVQSPGLNVLRPDFQGAARSSSAQVSRPGSLDLLLPRVTVPKSNSVSSTSSSFQATLDALRATQPAPSALPSVDRATGPTEDLSLLDVRSFWEKNRVVLLVGGGVLVAGLGLYLWRRR